MLKNSPEHIAFLVWKGEDFIKKTKYTIKEKDRAYVTDYLKRLLSSLDENRIKLCVQDIDVLRVISAVKKDDMKELQNIFNSALTRTGQKRLMIAVRQRNKVDRSKISIDKLAANKLRLCAKRRDLTISDYIESLIEKVEGIKAGEI